MSKTLNRSLISKILLVLLVASGAILIAWSITRNTLDNIKEPMARISAPDSALLTTQRLFNDVVMLDQLQRLHNLQPSVPTRQSIQTIQERIHLSLDQLQEQTGSDSGQSKALDSIRQLVIEQDRLFRHYSRQRRQHLTNDTLGDQIQLLAQYIAEEGGLVDTSLVTTKKIYSQIINEYDLVPIEEKPNFLARLFGSRKTSAPKKIQTIKEEEHIEIDTVRLPPEDSILNQLSHSIVEGEIQRRARLEELLSQRQAMSLASNKLVSSLLINLNKLEEESQLRNQQSNEKAFLLIHQGLNDLNSLLILFLVVILLLVLLIISDLYRINQYKKELVWARDEAESQAQAKHRFLANISHEIRSPLQVILGFAEQLHSSVPAEKQTKEGLELIHRSSQHLLHVVNEVLDYSRITSGKFQLNPGPFSPQQALKEVIRIIGFKAAEKKLKLHVHLHGEEDEFRKYHGDAFRLRQILFNLIDNAIKFTDSGSVEVSMQTQEEKTGSRFQIQIRDTGIGMDNATVSQLFEPFQPKGPSDAAGTGLGLTITRELVELQGGCMKVDSEPGKGTIVSLEIFYPFAVEKSSPTGRTAQHLPFEEVWLVEDDPLIRSLVSSILEKFSLPFRLFENGEALIETPFPDHSLVLLIDIRMPGTNGLDLAAALEEKARIHPHPLKKIALTAQLISDIQADPRSVHFDTILTKPFEEADLLKAIQRPQSSKPPKPAFELGKELWDQVKKETDKDLHVLQMAFRNKDKDAAIGLVHKLAGRFGQIGWSSESRICRQFEMQWKKSEGHLEETEVETLIRDVRNRLAVL